MNQQFQVTTQASKDRVADSYRGHGHQFYILRYRFIHEGGTLRCEAHGARILVSGEPSKREDGEANYNYPLTLVPPFVWEELAEQVDANIERDMRSYEWWSDTTTANKGLRAL